MRKCGCDDRGRHKRTCQLHIQRKQEEGIVDVQIPYDGEDTDEHLSYLFVQAYGKPPHLEWFPNKIRQATIEKRITNYVKRFKPFYLTTTTMDKDSDEVETWYIDGGNWAYKKGSNEYNILVGHIKNCLEFVNGRQPKWKRRRRN